MLWISRAVFEHLRPSTLTSWQAGRVVDNHAALEAGLLAAIQVKLEAASPSTVEHVKKWRVRARQAGREVRNRAALAADLSAQAGRRWALTPVIWTSDAAVAGPPAEASQFADVLNANREAVVRTSSKTTAPVWSWCLFSRLRIIVTQEWKSRELHPGTAGHL